MTKLCPLLAICAMTATASALSAASTFDEVFSEGKVSISSRLRFETGDQPGLASAEAFTLRNRLGFTSGKLNHLYFMIEGEDVHAFDGDSYSQAGLNPGGAGQVVIADVEGTEVNQAFVGVTAGNVEARLGRQRIVRDNARFVGDVGWRQDQQTYDAFSYTHQASEDLTLSYGYLWHINRIFGDVRDWKSDSHLLNVTYQGFGSGTFSAYGYLLDFDHAAANSCATYGASYHGTLDWQEGRSLLYRAEAATQSDYGNSPSAYTALYWLAELGVKIDGLTAKIGYEVLGSDHGVGFKTPLATLHAFNGFADLFLGTPGTGLKDAYVSLGGPIGSVNVTAFYHQFTAESGGADYGTEFDLVAAYKFSPRLLGIAKYAAFQSDGFARDTDRLTVEINFTY